MITYLLHPCPGCPVTQFFGENPGIYTRTNGHNGIDFGGSEATVIRAAYPGQVIEAHDGGYDGYGLHVTLQHAGGKTIYGHMSQLNVTVGQTVQADDALGQMGNTGWSSGIHLHFEFRPGTANIATDPMPLIVATIPNARPLCRAVLLKAGEGLSLRTQPSKDRTYIRTLAIGEEIEIYDFLPMGWVRTGEGYCLSGEGAERWLQFLPFHDRTPTMQAVRREDNQ